MKQSFIPILSILSLVISPLVWADEAEYGENIEPTIITDNFKVENDTQAPNGSGTEKAVKNENELGKLGNKKVVVGNRVPHHLAYVKNSDNSSYIIKDSILVKCAKGVDCIPPGLSASKLSSTVYEVTVKSYDEWKAVQDELRSAAGVINVAPSYEHGISPSLK